MRERLGNCRASRNRIEQGLEIAKQVAHQAFRYVALQAGELVDELAEAERLIVENVDQLAHGLNALGKVSAVLREPGCGNVAGGERGVYGVGGKFTAMQRQHDAR